MKFAVIYNEIEKLRYFVTDVDMPPYQGIYINLVPEDDDEQNRQDSLTNIMYDPETGEDLQESCSLSDFQKAIQAGAQVIKCGFNP